LVSSYKIVACQRDLETNVNDSKPEQQKIGVPLSEVESMHACLFDNTVILHLEISSPK
jgi:hypothetical protein